MPSQSLVLFDLDHTLVPWDSEVAFVTYLTAGGHLAASEVEARSAVLTEQYNRGEAGAIEFCEFFLHLLARFEPDELERLRRRWVDEEVRIRITAEARALVAGHRAAGDWIVVSTAVFRGLAELQVAEFGIEDLLATEAEYVDGRLTGRVAGIANSREGKVERLREWLSQRGHRLDDFAELRVYADSINDLALLSHATHPVAVNPDPVLSAHARHAGWETRWLPDGERVPDGAEKGWTR